MAYYNAGGTQGAAGSMYGTGNPNRDIFEGNLTFGRDYYNTGNQGRAGFSQWTQNLGGSQKFKDYVQNKFNILRDEYSAAAGQDQELTWTDFLLGNQDKLVTDYSNLGPSGRFEQPGRSLGKLRWL